MTSSISSSPPPSPTKEITDRIALPNASPTVSFLPLIATAAQNSKKESSLDLSQRALTQAASSSMTQTTNFNRAQRTIERFQEHKVLARAMDAEVLAGFDNDRRNFEFRTHAQELDLMGSGTKMKFASCTLFVANHRVTTYKPYGFLFDSTTTEVLCAATHDVTTSNTADSMMFPDSEKVTLDELRTFILTTPSGNRSGMNEVKAHLSTGDILAQFVNKSDNKANQLEAILVNKWLKEKHGLDIPLFTYDGEKGTLELYDIPKNALGLIQHARSRSIPLAQEVAKQLGFTVTEKGRITPNS